jgi:hypothetical protein
LCSPLLQSQQQLVTPTLPAAAAFPEGKPGVETEEQQQQQLFELFLLIPYQLLLLALQRS